MSRPNLAKINRHVRIHISRYFGYMEKSESYFSLWNSPALASMTKIQQCVSHSLPEWIFPIFFFFINLPLNVVLCIKKTEIQNWWGRRPYSRVISQSSHHHYLWGIAAKRGTPCLTISNKGGLRLKGRTKASGGHHHFSSPLPLTHQTSESVYCTGLRRPDLTLNSLR